MLRDHLSWPQFCFHATHATRLFSDRSGTPSAPRVLFRLGYPVPHPAPSPKRFPRTAHPSASHAHRSAPRHCVSYIVTHVPPRFTAPCHMQRLSRPTPLLLQRHLLAWTTPNAPPFVCWPHVFRLSRLLTRSPRLSSPLSSPLFSLLFSSLFSALFPSSLPHSSPRTPPTLLIP